MARAEKGPVSCEIAAEERAFGDDEEQAHDSSHDVAGCVEKEELGKCQSLLA
jgi:hypothetical protein